MYINIIKNNNQLHATYACFKKLEILNTLGNVFAFNQFKGHILHTIKTNKENKNVVEKY